MIDNYDNVPENSKENAEEIYNEIIRMLRSENKDAFLGQKNVLPERLKNLIDWTHNLTLGRYKTCTVSSRGGDSMKKRYS